MHGDRVSGLEHVNIIICCEAPCYAFFNRATENQLVIVLYERLIEYGNEWAINSAYRTPTNTACVHEWCVGYDIGVTHFFWHIEYVVVVIGQDAQTNALFKGTVCSWCQFVLEAERVTEVRIEGAFLDVRQEIVADPVRLNDSRIERVSDAVLTSYVAEVGVERLETGE